MNDIFKDMQVNVGCEYISDLPSYKRKVWQEMKRLNPADYEERQLEDFSKYVFGISYQTLKDVMKILLMYFFLGMSDTEIGDRLKIDRSTSFRSRKNSLEEIKKKLKENMNDE